MVFYSSIAFYTAVKTCKTQFEQSFKVLYSSKHISTRVNNWQTILTGFGNFKSCLHLLLIIKTHWELTFSPFLMMTTLVNYLFKEFERCNLFGFEVFKISSSKLKLSENIQFCILKHNYQRIAAEIHVNTCWDHKQLQIFH